MDIFPFGTVAVPASIRFLPFGQPQNSVGGQILSSNPVIKVHVADANNAPIFGASVAISFNGAPPCSTAVLSGTLTAQTNGNGNAVFPDLSIDRGQTGYTLLATAGSASAVSQPFTVNGFCETGNLNVARRVGTATLLPNGKVLIAGGFVPGALATASAELFDPNTGLFTLTGSMNVAREFHTATLLPSGKVLIAGGDNSANPALSSAELYDPATGVFILTSSMNSAHDAHAATLLADGRVLITGGFDRISSAVNAAEIYDSASGVFANTGNMVAARGQHVATLLTNGTVLLTGGADNSGNPLATAEIFDPARGTFAPTGSMSTPRIFQSQSLLPNGKVLVAGGTVALVPIPGTSFFSDTPTATAELYDSATGTFSLTVGSLNAPDGAPAAAVLVDGNVLVTNGSTSGNITGNAAEIYQTATGTFAVTGSMAADEIENTIVLLNDGTVLDTGGNNNNPAGLLYYSTAPLAPITITTTSLFNAALGKPFTQIFLEQGGLGNLTWSETGTLPAGINFSAQGVLSGTPATTGSFPLTFTVTDSSSPVKTTSLALTLNVAGGLTFTSSTLPTAIVSVPYNQPLPFTGGTAPFNAVITSGAMPSGLTLSASGVISGTTSNLGPASFTVQVTDSSVPPQIATQSFTLQVAGSLGFITTSLPNGTVSVAYSQSMATSGGLLPVSFAVTSGTLPAGLGITQPSSGSQTATLSGTPTTAATYNFTITATDSSTPAQSISLPFSVTIASGALPPATATFVNQPQNSIGGQLLSGGPFIVQVNDSTGAPLSGATVVMSFLGTPPCPTAILGGTLTQTTNAAGQAVFSDLTIDRGQNGYILTATANANGGAATSGPSNPFTVNGFCLTGSMSVARELHTEILLPNGKVLIAGGANNVATLNTAELFDPPTGTTTATGNLAAPNGRRAHASVLLQNGQVLLIGGFDNASNPLASAELYNPANGTFTATGSMATARARFSGVLLADGRVLVSGGHTNSGVNSGALSASEIYNPATGAFTATGSLNVVRERHTMTLLPNGMVLVAGGLNFSGPPGSVALSSAELFDPNANSGVGAFTLIGNMNSARDEARAVLLPNGTVLIAGGFASYQTGLSSSTADIYNPATNTFTLSANSMSVARAHPTLTLLPDGTAVVAGGVPDTGATTPSTTSADIFNPATGAFSATGAMNAGREYARDALLPSGNPLVSGGDDGINALSSEEIYYSTAPLTPLSIATTVLPPAYLNQPYVEQLQAQGGVGNLTWTLTSGTLPAGITLSASGLLSGTPTAISAANIQVKVTDSTGAVFTQSYILVAVPPVLVNPALPTANPGVAYTQPITVLTGTAPFTFSLFGGALPTGLSLASNGTVSGTTNVAPGTFTFVVKVTDSSTPPVSDNQTVFISVAPPVAITTTSLPSGTAAVPYSTSITASGGLPPVAFLLTSGALPSGLALNPNGTLSGTPSSAGSFNFSVTAADASVSPQLSAPQAYTVVIGAGAALVLAPASLANASLGVAYSQGFTVTGGLPPYNVTLSGTLPGGLTFNGASNPPAITGTPSLVGTFASITVTVTDSQIPAMHTQVTYTLVVVGFSAACGSGNESLLTGPFAILMQGFDVNGPRTLIGSLNFNGAGLIPSGQVDLGFDVPAGGGSAQHLSIIAAQSSFSVGADLRGCMVITTSAGSTSYRFVLGGVTNGTARGGRVIEYLQNGTYATGVMTAQDPVAIAAQSISGPWAFAFATASSLANVGHWAVTGSFSALNGAVTGQSWDFNDTHSLDSGNTWAAAGLAFPANEAYTFDGTSRGTIQLPSVQQYSANQTLASANCVTYVVNSSEMYAAVIPDANNKPLIGDIQQQVSPFNSLTLNGAGYVEGTSAAPIFSGAWVGLFSANSSAWNLSLDNDSGGTYTTAASSGSYAVDANGRTPLSFTGSNSPGPLLRVIGPNKVFFMLADGTAALGFVHHFSGGAPPASIAGTYAVGSAQGAMDRKVANLSGIAVFDSAGNVTFTEDQATGSTSTLASGVVVSSTYAYNAATGRGVIPATGPPQRVFVATGPSTIYLLDVTAVDPQVQELDGINGPLAVTLSPDPLNLVTNSVGNMTATLSTAAGASGQSISLASSNSGVASVPPTVTVPANSNSVMFQVTAGATPGNATIIASSAGFASGTAAVIVTALPMSLATDGPLLAVNRSFNATVTLGSPVPAGSTVTVTLVSDTPGLITISPASQIIAAGQSTAVFSLTAGSAAGSLNLTASAPGYTNATTPLTVTTAVISLQTGVSVAPGQSVSMALSLSQPAPVGGLTVNLTSSAPGNATVTPSVFIPAGAQTPSSNPQVTGILIGSTNITATAVGFGPDTQPVNVTVTATLSPNPVAVVSNGGTTTVTVSISAPAPAGGIVFTLKTDSAPTATVPAQATVIQGATSVQFQVTGIAVGPTILRADSTGIQEATATVNVNPAPSINIASSFSIGQNLQVSAFFSLAAAAPAGGVTVTVTSADTTKLLLSQTGTDAGSGTQQFTVPAGSLSPSGALFLYALQGTGTVQFSLSAPGYTTSTTTVNMEPSGFIINFPGAINTTTFSGPTTVQVTTAALTPGTLTYAGNQAVRGGIGPFSISLSLANGSVGTLTPATLTFSGGDIVQNTSFQPSATGGTTTLNLGTPPTGFSTPSQFQQISVAVNLPVISMSTLTIGNNLQSSMFVGLGATPPSPVSVTITTNPTQLLLSQTGTDAGSSSVTFTNVTSNFVGTLYVYSLQSSGTAQINATAPGYANSSATITMVPSGFIINFPGAINTTTFSGPTAVQVTSAALTPGTLTYAGNQTLRPGVGPFSISLSLTGGTPGTLTPSTLTFNGGNSFQNSSFQPTTAGNANITLGTPPSGFSTPSQFQQIPVAVTAPAIFLTNLTIGNNLQTFMNVTLGAVPPSPISVTITTNPTQLLLSQTGTDAGSSSVTFTNVTSNFVGALYVYSLQSSGTAQINATATGYANGSATITTVPSGFIINFPGVINTTTFSGPTAVQVTPAALTPGTLTYAGNQTLRPGIGPFSISLSLTGGTPGTLTPSTLTFNGGNSFQNSSFQPTSAGTATLVLGTQPSGFSTPSQFQQIPVSVSAPSINVVPSVIVGLNLQVGITVQLQSAPPNPVTVTATSPNSSIASVTADPALVGGASAAFNAPAGSIFVGTLWIQGISRNTTQLKLSAPGYSDAFVNVTVNPSGFIINSPGNFTVSAGSNTTVQLAPAVLDPITLNYAGNQTVRAGLTVGVNLISSNTTVGTISTSPVVFTGNTSFANTSFQAVAPGTTFISVATPSGFSTPSNFQQIQGTVQ